MRKITLRDIEIGKPIACDCFDKCGILLLKRGVVINNAKQLSALLDRGLFANAPANERAAKQPIAAPVKTSPFDSIDKAKNSIGGMIAAVRVGNDVSSMDRIVFESLKDSYRGALSLTKEDKLKSFPERILNVSKGIQALCEIDADAALGIIHLDHDGRYTVIHPMHQAILAELIAKRMNIMARERLSIIAAALTANISIIDLQENLHRQDAPLTPEQKEMMRLHPLLSVEMLLELGVQDDLWIKTVLHHHERLDGNGYPCGIGGDGIPLSVRIISLADIYGAMIKHRSYREAALAKDAMRELFMKRGADTDGELTQVFIKEMGLFPPGSFVKLQNSETAIVIKRGGSATTPLVKSVVGPRGAPLDRPIVRDTAESEFTIKEIAPRDKIVGINLRSLWGYDSQ